MPAAEWLLAAAVALDLMIGDPQGWPHPVRLIGRFALAVEGPCRWLGGNTRLAGGLAVALVLAATAAAVALPLIAASLASEWLAAVVAVYFLYSGLALRDLVAHSQRVHEALTLGDLDGARQRVGMIVGRDIASLDAEGVARACVESVAENMVDGFVAPLFYAVLAGPVGIMLYKAVNTLDSTFGYKNERYLHFGCAAARLDDLANFLPARLGGLLLVLAAPLAGGSMKDAWRILRRDRLKHASPNSGHSEAAVAGALGVRLGGASSYFGRVVVKPGIGDPQRVLAPDTITRANRLVMLAGGLAVMLGIWVLRAADKIIRMI